MQPSLAESSQLASPKAEAERSFADLHDLGIIAQLSLLKGEREDLCSDLFRVLIDRSSEP